MLRIFLAIQLVCAALLLATCERINMHDLAKYGLPPQSAIYLFPLHSQAGNLGDRNSMDIMCYQEGLAYHTLVNASTVKAFLSFSVIDELRFLVPIQYWYFPVIGISPTLTVTTIASSWIELLSGASPPINPINTSVGIAVSFWTGSNADGSISNDFTCSGWNDSTGTFNGRFGQTIIDNGSVACNDITPYILCIAY